MSSRPHIEFPVGFGFCRIVKPAASSYRSHAAVAGRLIRFESIEAARCNIVAGITVYTRLSSEISKHDLRRASASSAVACFTVVTNKYAAGKRPARVFRSRALETLANTV